MKKVLLACLFVAAFSIQIEVQENSEFKQETIEFIEITGAGAAFESAIDQIGMRWYQQKMKKRTQKKLWRLWMLYMVKWLDFTWGSLQEMRLKN